MNFGEFEKMTRFELEMVVNVLKIIIQEKKEAEE